MSGMLAGACAPRGGGKTDEDEARTAAPGDGAAERRLLAIAEWSGMYHSTSLAVYDSGLLDRRFPVEDGEGPFGPTYRREYRVGMATPDVLDALRRDLASKDVLAADPHYHEAGVMDGGSLTLAVPQSDRRIVVVNDPTALPPALSRLGESLQAMARLVEQMGYDPFDHRLAPPPGRMLLVHETWRQAQDDAYVLTLFEHGDIELRKTSDGSDSAHRRRDYQTPRSTVRALDPLRYELLRDAAEALKSSAVPRVHEAGSREGVDRHWLALGGPDGRFEARTDEPLPSELQRVLDVSSEIAADYLP